MTKLLKRFTQDESGATAIEYGLICALIFIVILSAVTAFGQAGTGVFKAAAAAIVAAIAGGG